MRATILENKYIPHVPTPKQARFLLEPAKEAMYGGAAGGGKSDALLMAALQYVHVPGYSAILFRRTYTDLALPGALMDRALQWLAPFLDTGEVKWSEKHKTFTFPSGATISFAYLQHENDKYRYQGTDFQFIGFDELTQFTESQYRYLFSRLRKEEGFPVPLRMRVATNPGGIGHEWVKQRFIIEGPSKGRVFVPARMEDNPHLDQEEYERSLAMLDPVTRRQLRYGDWDAAPEGEKFKRSWFEIVSPSDVPRDARRVRYWDMAATEPKPGEDPDWTVGARVAEKDGIFFIEDIRRFRATPRKVEELIRETAEADGREVDIWMEQEPGSSGKIVIDHFRRKVLIGFTFRGNRATGSKETRANPVSAMAEAGNVKLVRGDWIGDFLDEAVQFPNGAHDDQVDAVSGAFEVLSRRNRPKVKARILS